MRRYLGFAPGFLFAFGGVNLPIEARQAGAGIPARAPTPQKWDTVRDVDSLVIRTVLEVTPSGQIKVSKNEAHTSASLDEHKSNWLPRPGTARAYMWDPKDFYLVRRRTAMTMHGGAHGQRLRHPRDARRHKALVVRATANRSLAAAVEGVPVREDPSMHPCWGVWCPVCKLWTVTDQFDDVHEVLKHMKKVHS